MRAICDNGRMLYIGVLLVLANTLVTTLYAYIAFVNPQMGHIQRAWFLTTTGLLGSCVFLWALVPMTPDATERHFYDVTSTLLLVLAGLIALAAPSFLLRPVYRTSDLRRIYSWVDFRHIPPCEFL